MLLIRRESPDKYTKVVGRIAHQEFDTKIAQRLSHQVMLRESSNDYFIWYLQTQWHLDTFHSSVHVWREKLTQIY